jgi:hypothetical protein
MVLCCDPLAIALTAAAPEGAELIITGYLSTKKAKTHGDQSISCWPSLTGYQARTTPAVMDAQPVFAKP